MAVNMYMMTIRRITPMGRIRNRFNEMLQAKSEKTGENLTLQVVSLQTRLSYGTVMKWSKNRVNRYDDGTLATLCEYFDCQPGDLLEYIDE